MYVRDVIQALNIILIRRKKQLSALNVDDELEDIMETVNLWNLCPEQPEYSNIPSHLYVDSKTGTAFMIPANW